MEESVRNYVYLAILLFALTSCVYGPKTEKKSALNVLNGENYETSNNSINQLVIPVAKRKERMTEVAGRVVIKSEIVETPVKYVEVQILDENGNILHSGNTDANGDFAIFGVLSNGKYQFSLNSDKYVLHEELSVDQYKIENLVLVAKTKCIDNEQACR